MTEDNIVIAEVKKEIESEQPKTAVAVSSEISEPAVEQNSQSADQSEVEKMREELAQEKAENEALRKELSSLKNSSTETTNTDEQANAKEAEASQEAQSSIYEQVAQGQWKAEYEAVVGLKHRKPMPPQPCQDAAFAGIEPRPMVISADGAGSSIASDIGSQRVVTGVKRLIDTLYPSQFSALDNADDIAPEIYQRWALILVKHAKGILEDLAAEYRRPMKDFRCTLLTAIVGKEHTFWFKVGDGALVVERLIEQNGELDRALEHVGKVGKGEYANQTTFIDENLSKEAVDFNILDSKNITAFFSMSDGAALKCVKNDGSQVAASLSRLAQNLRDGELQRTTLTKFFYSESFLANHDGDDCSMAIIAR